MNSDNNYTPLDAGLENIVSKTEPTFKKTKSEVWEEISGFIDQTPVEKKESSKSVNLRIYSSVAAAVIVLFGTYFFMKNYSTAYYCNGKNNINITLPAGSVVSLAPESAITYYPLWWRISRNVELSGEAFFEVAPGNSFIVNSTLGSTEVVGTSFNIISHSDAYNVKCVTGKVKVKSKTDRETILTPEYQANIGPAGTITVTKFNSNSDLQDDNTFRFTSTPLNIVISELKKHYNININTSNELDYLYTGVFSKNKTADEALTIICKPFGLTFVKNSDKGFIIFEK